MPSSASRLIFLPLVVVACSTPQYGELPARCSDGECPEGYACIHNVCAAPNTPVPITITQVSNLRGIDLRLVPETSSVLVVWQLYAYSSEGERFVAVRVTPDGVVSPRMDLVTSFAADEGAVEPYYDVLAISDQKLLLAVSSSPLPDDEQPTARLLTYSVTLPPKGQETTKIQFSAAWNAEERMDTVGYGAVSRPKLVAQADHVELGYVRSRAIPENCINMVCETSQQQACLSNDDCPISDIAAELAVFPLQNDGAQLGAPLYHPVRNNLTVAVGVVSAFSQPGGTFWVMDDVRPSTLFVPDGAMPADVPPDVALERLGIALDAPASSLLYIEPSTRQGDKLPTDPVSGSASLRRVNVMGGPPWTYNGETIAQLAPIRDTPRPAWLRREGKPALLVTPGADIDTPALLVYRVNPDTGEISEATRIERFSSSQIDATEAVLVNGKLFVAWIDATDDTAAIRMAVLPEP